MSAFTVFCWAAGILAVVLSPVWLVLIIAGIRVARGTDHLSMIEKRDLRPVQTIDATMRAGETVVAVLTTPKGVRTIAKKSAPRWAFWRRA